ncbi:sugar phosphate isomerase/epimerase family protein [Microlunatus speluncae]|uniref:sugar phosphate isomerase/epimerase family protein n=1 Tax=Microlunatus speluncae TaxID=2594267 RepID=UPI0012663BC7|nr:TIM barrel protein [Microlunatus speluncae]
MVTWSVFSKPWRTLAPGPLAELIAGLGFTGVEVPVRPGCFLDPDNAGAELPGFVRTLAEHGIEVISVAADPVEPVFAACAEAGVGMIRTMAPVGDDGYRASVDRLRRDWADRVVPLSASHGVRVGVQLHRGKYVETTLGVLALIEELPGFELVWDAAHDALTGVDPVRSLDLAWPRLGLVNLKNGEYYRTAADSASSEPRYRVRSGPADSGMADWARIIAHLRRRDWAGPVCLTAEYSDASGPDQVAELVRADLTTARDLWDRTDL